MKQSNEKTILGFIPLDISKRQAEGTGMAAALIFLLWGYYAKNPFYYTLAIPILLVNMTAPKLFYPAAVVWFSLSNLLSMVMPKIILTIVYAIIVFPVGQLRRLSGYDPLLLKQWKKNYTSVMKSRMHTYQPIDIEKPY